MHEMKLGEPTCAGFSPYLMSSCILLVVGTKLYISKYLSVWDGVFAIIGGI